MHHLSLSMLPLLLSFIFFLSSPAIADDPFKAWQLRCATDHYNANSTFDKNLNSTLKTLIADSSTSLYSNTTVGQVPNRVFGLYLCRGDTNSTDCNKCVKNANHDLHQNCSYSKSAVVWYDYCLAYYSQEVLSLTDNSIQLTMWNQNPVSPVDRFNDLVLELLNATADYAVNGTNINSYATGSITGFTAQYSTLYGLVQCTPDMSGRECRQCLQPLFDDIVDTSKNLYGKLGGRVIGVRCNMRYEVGQFFQGDPMIKLAASLSPTPSPSPSTNPSSSSTSSPPSSTPSDTPPAVASPLATPPATGASGKESWLGIALGMLMPLLIAALCI